MSLPRAVRNNNPLNIRRTTDKWVGLCAVQSDNEFYRFISPLYGFRAAFIILRTYVNRYSVDTIEKIITRWAPPLENNTESYINTICSYINTSPSHKVSLHDKSLMVCLVKYMAKVESGKFYDDAVIRNAYDLVFPFDECR